MKKLILFSLLFYLMGCSGGLDEKKLLVIYDDAAKNASAQINEIMGFAAAHEINVDTTADLSMINETGLQYTSTVMLLGVPGEKFNYKQQADLERYIQAGGSLIAVDTDLHSKYKWPWQEALLAEVRGQNMENQLAIRQVNAGEEAQQPIPQGQYEFDGGRVSFITGSDLNSEKLSETINYAIGDNQLHYKKAYSQRVPDDNRFTRIVLDNDLNEPMELDVTRDGKVIFTEREGNVKMYDPEANRTQLLARFDVCTEGNYEDGLHGLALDPNFDFNHRIYIYYSVPCADSIQRLSRFFMAGDSLIMASEKTILEVPVQRETCCHSGGSVQFGPDGLLYLSTGDNTSSKESNGYTPIDERPGRSPFDAQKSSGNTHDLRGKILRIKVEKDGSYTIPNGNLFPKDGAKGRPEIYAMGCRNPFRISIDQKKGYLYWGDVGPDSGVDSEQGSQSYDEWNQAREAGFYGWPYFMANNIAFPDFDFVTNTPGQYFDPEHPVNNSPNNYGSKDLPPAKKAMIWYPYGESDIWPILGTGSRSAMAGPVYYAARYGNSDVKFPEYYNGKLFIYEWSRSWIQVVSFDENDNPKKIEPFLPDMQLSKPIDMEFGPDGAMYILEYGANYFANNDEARLVKIEYAEGNRKPVPQIAVDKSVGAAPLTIQFSAANSFDYDANDSLTYAWMFDDNEKVQSEEKKPAFTFEKPGIYAPKLIVTDTEGHEAEATVTVSVGNQPPEVNFIIGGNQSFYFDNGSLNYRVAVTDQEDGNLTSGRIDPMEVKLTFDYLQEGKDLALLGADALITPFAKGKALIDNSDCKACHAVSQKSIGPSYMEVAERYNPDATTVSMLAKKIISGGNGNWGHSMMAAHPQHSEEETSEMVKYILSLEGNGQAGGSMALDGTLHLDKHNNSSEAGSYILSATYKDKGANGMPALTTRKIITIRHPRLQAEDYDEFRNVQRQRPNDGGLGYVNNIKDGSYIQFINIDLTDIAALTYQVSGRSDGEIEVHLDSPDGPVVSKATVRPTGSNRDFAEVNSTVKSTEGLHNLFFVFKHKEKKNDNLFNLDWIYFHNQKIPL